MDIFLFALTLFLYFSGYRSLGWVGVLCLTTRYFGFGLNESFVFFKHTVSDVGLFASLLIFFFELLNGTIKIAKNIALAIYAIFCFLFIAAILDYYLNQTSFYDIVRSCKAWLILVSFFSLTTLGNIELKRILKLIVSITIVQTLVYYFQFYSGIKLYEQSELAYSMGNEIIIRGAFPPTFAFLSFLLLCSQETADTLNIKFRVVKTALILGTVILSVTRSILAAFIFGGILIVVLNRMNFKKVLGISLLGLLMLFMISNNKVFKQRIEEGTKDIVFAFSADYKNADPNETFSFRVFHFQERLNYLSKYPTQLLFGIGFIHETSLSSPLFLIGEISEDGSIVQIDTGDIAWSVLLLRLGLVGSSLYLIFYITMLLNFLKYKHLGFSKVAFVYLLINLLIFSLTSSIIAIPYFWLVIFILYHYQVSLNDYKASSFNNHPFI